MNRNYIISSINKHYNSASKQTLPIQKVQLNRISNSVGGMSNGSVTNTHVAYLPNLIQKEIIMYLLEAGYYMSLRLTCKLWKRISDERVRTLSIYFSDLHMQSSVKLVSEVFVRNIYENCMSLEEIQFINNSGSTLLYGEYYFNSLIHPFIETFLRYNKYVKRVVIKSFPISKINNISSQQISPKYKLYHSSSKNIGTSSTTSSITSNNSPGDCKSANSSPQNSPTKLVTTNINYNSLSIQREKEKEESANAHQLYYYLTNNQVIEELVLKSIGLDSKLKFDFFSSLSGNKTLRCLTLSDNISEEGIQLLSNLMKNKSLQNLETLNLQKNLLTCKSGPFIRVILESTSTLRTLDLSNNKISDSGLYLIILGLKSNKSLYSLNLDQNKFSSIQGDVDFGTTIKNLNLSRNMLNSSFIKSLGHYIRMNESMESLDLSYNQSTFKGTKSFANLISFNQTLRHLNLSFNMIPKVSLEYLIDSLSKSRVESLNLQGNKLDNESAIQISKLIFSRKEYPIRNINLSNNSIGLLGFKKITSNHSQFNKSIVTFRANNQLKYKMNFSNTPTTTTITTSSTTNTTKKKKSSKKETTIEQSPSTPPEQPIDTMEDNPDDYYNILSKYNNNNSSKENTLTIDLTFNKLSPEKVIASFPRYRYLETPITSNINYNFINYQI
ncbi:hypothetical protein DLAC_09369 [Tieghemostelium lacteum]|uniref:Leucine-rich repeat-containing protein (LRR) n=1 Tax=Tieghemostelium lacteum TaxID=361077 RepID=A0A151Z9W1_TIELA|nr:hypothetical protein DLAC_09369 [Tieghemostelium lacteum]|eukprot:KYQ90732.1 hypothetical protein DLAC_09369 [Tieghemostelium lacteum]